MGNDENNESLRKDWFYRVFHQESEGPEIRGAFFFECNPPARLWLLEWLNYVNTALPWQITKKNAGVFGMKQPKIIKGSVKMVQNNIKKIRTQNGITQKGLAERVQRTVQYIQRIEEEHESVKFAVAMKIAETLETPFPEIFPDAGEVVRSADNANKRIAELFRDGKLREQMENAGIDMFSGRRCFSYCLRGGADGVLDLTSQEQSRLWLNLQESESTRSNFISFYSNGWCVLLNPRHLIWAHFLYDAEDIREEEPANAVEIFFAESKTSLILDVEKDVIDPEEPDALGALGSLTCFAETLVEEGEFFMIEDIDDEMAFLRAEDVAMMRIPLWAFLQDLDCPSEEDGSQKEPSSL